MHRLPGLAHYSKSTILKLLFRFYDITNSSILFNGRDLTPITLSSLRDSIGLVPRSVIKLSAKMSAVLASSRAWQLTTMRFHNESARADQVSSLMKQMTR